MERLITEIGEVEQIERGKSITKGEVKKVAKSSKVFRTLQLTKYHVKKVCIQIYKENY